MHGQQNIKIVKISHRAWSLSSLYQLVGRTKCGIRIGLYFCISVCCRQNWKLQWCFVCMFFYSSAPSMTFWIKTCSKLSLGHFLLWNGASLWRAWDLRISFTDLDSTQQETYRKDSVMYNPFVTRQLNTFPHPPSPMTVTIWSYCTQSLAQRHSSFGEIFPLTMAVHGIACLSEIVIPAKVVHRSSC
jgi:hypothetical protein